MQGKFIDRSTKMRQGREREKDQVVKVGEIVGSPWWIKEEMKWIGRGGYY